MPVSLTFSDDDRNIQFTVAAKISVTVGCPGDLITPPEGTLIEVDAIVDIESIVTFVGAFGVEADLASVDHADLMAMCDELAEKYAHEIHRAAVESYAHSLQYAA